jgi:hypothetical protein
MKKKNYSFFPFAPFPSWLEPSMIFQTKRFQGQKNSPSSLHDALSKDYPHDLMILPCRPTASNCSSLDEIEPDIQQIWFRHFFPIEVDFIKISQH